MDSRETFQSKMMKLIRRELGLPETPRQVASPGHNGPPTVNKSTLLASMRGGPRDGDVLPIESPQPLIVHTSDAAMTNPDSVYLLRFGAEKCPECGLKPNIGFGIAGLCFAASKEGKDA